MISFEQLGTALLTLASDLTIEGNLLLILLSEPILRLLPLQDLIRQPHCSPSYTF